MTVEYVDPAYRFNELSAYAHTVVQTFAQKFPSRFSGATRQAHALLAAGLAVQLQRQLSRTRVALNFLSSAEQRTASELLAYVVAPAYAAYETLRGVDGPTLSVMVDDFVPLSMPTLDVLNDQLVSVAGSELCVSFTDPYSFTGAVQKDSLIAQQVDLYDRISAVIAAEDTVLGPNASRNFAFVALAEQIRELVLAAGVALEYLFLQESDWLDSARRQNMISSLVDSTFAAFVGSYGVCHEAALCFASGFSAIVLDVAETQFQMLESARRQYADEAAASAAQAARQLFEQNLSQQLNQLFGALAHFTPADRPGQVFDRFEVAFDGSGTRLEVFVRIPPGEWTWPANTSPPAGALIAGESWQVFSSRIPRVSPDGYPVDIRVQPVIY